MSALENSLSPFLRLHKDNPVAWRVWGPEALADAEAADKPIFLSIGYTGCHWCHVMNAESFPDPATAALLNEHFIPVLLDREERPDIDQFYQSALPLMSLQGGWPLNLVLTPDGAPFFVTQYVPKQERLGTPSFDSVLTDAAAFWNERRPQAMEQAANIRRDLETQYGADLSAGPETVQLDLAAMRIAQRYDIFFGGQIGTPKMPLACQLEALWRAWLRTGLPQYSQLLFSAMDNMLYGGLWDHVGGGFFRYCHDERWQFPHFEKALADNALMLDILSYIYQINRSALVRSRAEELVAWLLRQMKLPGGGFASHLDSQSDGQEALYYIWTEMEVDAALAGTFAAKFKSIYEISRDGNFFGRNVPRRLSQSSQPTSDADEALLSRQRALLLAARDKRTPPMRDDKLLADANGLAIAALAQAGAVFERADWAAEAVTAFNAVAATLGEGGRLYHSALDGKHGGEGFADDYANMARAALQLYEVSGDKGFLEKAKTWAATLDAHYWDEARGGYFYTADTGQPPVLRPRFHTDNPGPAANAAMLGVLSRLILLTGDQSYTQRAPLLLRAFADEAGRSFPSMAGYLNGAETYSMALHVVVFGARGNPQTQELIRTVWGKALPGRLLVVVEPGMSLPAGHPCADVGMQNGQPTAYVCQGATRAGPITSPVLLGQLLTLPQQKKARRMSLIAIAGGMRGYLAKPQAPNGAGVVVIQEIFGVNAVMRERADDLAKEGYLALVPDLFWRLEPGVDITDQTDAEWKKALDLMNRFDVAKGVEDIQAAIDTVRAMPGIRKVGAVGYCLGGLFAYLTAARTGADASVGYYGVNIPAFLGEAANIRKPLLLHIAAEDAFVPKPAQDVMAAGLKDNPLVTLHRYDGVDHAFARPGGKHFNQAAATLANSRTAEFFRRHLA